MPMHAQSASHSSMLWLVIMTVQPAGSAQGSTATWLSHKLVKLQDLLSPR